MIGFFDLRKEEEDYFKEQFGSDHFYTSEPVSADKLTGKEIDTLCVFVSSVVDQDVIDAAPALEHITTRSTGYDHIDMDYAEEKGVAVSRVPAYGQETVAEFTFALMLTLSRKIFDAYHQVREAGDYSFKHLRGFDLSGKTLGVVGTGRIGSRVIKIAKGFDMDVVALDAKPQEHLAEELDFTYVDDLDRLLSMADIVTLHVPYNDSTHHLIDESALSAMKEGAYLINTSRGEVIDTASLISALQSEQIAGAALDVLEGERQLKDEAQLVMGDQSIAEVQTLLEDHILIDMPNVVVTPHIAFYTEEAELEILDTAAENIHSFNKKGEAKYAI